MGEGGGRLSCQNKLNNTKKCFYISYMCIHVCICICVCMYVSMHACMYACIYVCMYVCTYTNPSQVQFIWKSKQHCDLPQIIIVISPTNHEKKI